MACPQPDWLAHTLTVSGPTDAAAAFRRAAAGAGAIPWALDPDRMSEDLFHLLLTRECHIGAQAARALARGYRDLASAHHDRVLAAVGHSRACPLDLHALLPVPPAILRLGPDEPASLRWLWRHWGTTRPLRRVVLLPGSADRRRRRSARLDLCCDLRPDYGPPPDAAAARGPARQPAR